jgi:hypothetical protein
VEKTARAWSVGTATIQTLRMGWLTRVSGAASCAGARRKWLLDPRTTAVAHAELRAHDYP